MPKTVVGRQQQQQNGLGADCTEFEKYGDPKGTTVSVFTPIVAPEDKPHIDSYRPFEQCTGVTEGSDEFEAQLNVRVEDGNAPDIATCRNQGCCVRW